MQDNDQMRKKQQRKLAKPLNHWLFLSGATPQAAKAVCRFQTFIEFAPCTIPPASQRPSGLIAVMPFPMCGLEQYRFPEESRSVKASLVLVKIMFLT